MAARPRWRCAAGSPPRPMRAPPPTMRRSPTGSRASVTTTRRTIAAFGGRLDRDAALRRKSAPVRGVLPHAEHALRRRHRAAGAGQAALLQQHQRHRRGLRDASPSSIRRAPRPAPSSSTPIRAAWPRATSLLEAYRKALACDPVSAFGGIVALNRPLDAEAARAIVEIFTEVIIAPDADATRRSRSWRQRRICGCCWPAACPIRAPRA